MNSVAHAQSSIDLAADEREYVVLRWKQAVTLASKVGKGFSKDDNAQQLIVKHWLEAIDPLHRYGEIMKLYYDVWIDSHSPQPFLFWLDFGDGKDIDLEERPRTELQQKRVCYLGSKEREEYEVIIENGKLVYKRNGGFVNTTNLQWIYVLSTSRRLFVGQKDKGLFQHSSFLSGAATLASGLLVVSNGILQAIWSYSGHYHPTEENFKQLLQFLTEQKVDLRNVKLCPVDKDGVPIVLKSDANN